MATLPRRAITPATVDPEPPGVVVGQVKPDKPVAPAKPAKVDPNERVHIWISTGVRRADAERWLAYWQPRIGSPMRMYLSTKDASGAREFTDFMRTAIDPEATYVEVNNPWMALEDKRNWYWPPTAPAKPAKPVTEAAEIEPADAPVTSLKRRPIASAPIEPTSLSRRPLAAPQTVKPLSAKERAAQSQASHEAVASMAKRAGKASLEKVAGSNGVRGKSGLLFDALLKSKSGLTLKEQSAITGWSPGIKLLTKIADRTKHALVDHGNGRYSFR